MRAASNSGPLIHLARAGALRLLKDLYGEVLIPSEVEVEVVLRGKEKGCADALIVEEAVREGWVRVVEVSMPRRYVSLALKAGVHEAEAKVVWLAREEGLVALLDDNAAREFARLLGVRVRGSLGVVVEAVRGGMLDKGSALRILDRLCSVMYLSAEVYREARRTIEEL